MKVVKIILLFMIFYGDLFSQSPYFYTGKDYGSEATYNPISVILNGGFDMLQVERKRDLTKLPFYHGHKNLMKNLADPIHPIERYGWDKFLRDQVIPFSIKKSDAQYWPNYTLHLIGGGMTYTRLKEWYQYNDFPQPEIFTVFTVGLYHYINEVVENGAYKGDNVDPIADVYLFDIGGCILFSFDNINKFFSETMNLSDWSLQPSFSLRNLELHNNGQFFSIKWKFPFSDKWHLFYYFGTNGVGGLSYKYDNGDALSAGVGLAAKDLILLNKHTNKKTLDLVWNIGFFYDRNNSLLASLSITKKTDYMINFNIYPGLIKIGNFSPGLWTAYNKNGSLILGINASWNPFGICYSIE